MARCPGLPFLPGFTFNPLIGKTKFNMDPQFDFIEKGVTALVEKVKPNMMGPLSDRYPSLYPRGEVPEIPTWIGYDKQILRFYAFFRETLQEFRAAPFQIRKVVIYLFLEDGTIQVTEPKIDNSGISQGTLLARGRVRFPAPMDANFYDIIDLNIGNEVEFYGRVYKITDCDRFTRNFLNRCGITVPDPISIPDDPYYKDRARMSEAMFPKKPNRKTDTLGKFLKNDRKVLRFYGFWDDRETQYGYLHHLEIHYYLADDTIDIKEVVVDNGGNSSSFVFIRRAKLVKTYKGLPGIGAHAEDTLLNVLGNDIKSMRNVVDNLCCGKEYVEYYKEQDLTIGGVLNCYGRKVVLTDCDPFTKEYYRIKYGLDAFTPIPKPEEENMAVVSPAKRELPPWNGYGTHEDSAQNCITVDLKPPRGDFPKFLKYDKQGFDSRVLRFEARMISKVPDNCSRIFVISYFLNNDTISVFELARNNSGFKSSSFFKRAEIPLPGQAVFSSKPPECYRIQHIFVGATMIINNFEFVLIDADDYALRYMELNCQQFPKSNIKLIMDKVRKVLRPIYKDFVAENIPTESSVITYQKLREKLCRVMGKDFTEQEMITIARAYSGNCVKERYDREAIRAITLTELKRFLWDDIERLSEYFIHFDMNKTGTLTRKEVYTLLKACRLPLDVVLVNRILDVIRTDEKGNLIYNDLIHFLNRDTCPLTDVIPINIKYDLYWSSEKDIQAGKLINWCEFNKELNLEQEIIDAAGQMLHKHH
ncbi:hypothetical protein RN001_008258 [Aquatica leii]|uniref:EF-hand domain-containing family member C2 n=1 Tax=Aquatica leii TaxID=1421715 RepID=A0AAN7SGI4_9COLE|nr:hypothetical protein RN001_008258 [Aquatica leii]